MSITGTSSRRDLLIKGSAVASIGVSGGWGRAVFARQATPGASTIISLDPTPPAELGAPAVPPATISTASEAAPEGDVFARYDEFGTDADPGQFPRVIRHAFGDTTIESQPQRIVALDAGELDSVMYLGLTPVGAVEFEASRFPTQMAERAAGITVVGTLSEPDIEAIVALQPDLIISSALRHDENIFANLSAIAPTVFSAQPGVSFKQNFKLYAQALGREADARVLIDTYENGVRALNAQLPDPRPTTTIVQIRPDHVRYYQRANFLGQVLTDLGFPRNDGENVDDFAYIGSQEELGTYADGEFLILIVSEGENDLAAEILNGDLWQTLPAVQADNVLEAPSEIFIAGVSYGSAMEVLNIIGEHFGLDPVIDLSGL
jgi:iron complex transport system substrate-binding protein